jgi:hypothetical protein
MKYLKIDFVTPSVKTLSNFCTFFLQVTSAVTKHFRKAVLPL